MSLLMNALGIALILVGTISHASDVSCAIDSDINALVECILEKSPAIRSSKLEQQVASAAEATAAQRPNLQFSGSGGPSQGSSGTGNQFQLALLHTIELGSKRASRIERAKAGVARSSAEILQATEETKTNLILAFVRLRQISNELEYVQEAFTTLRKIGGTYRKRGSLSPDQEVAVENFELAAQTYELEKAQLGFEEQDLQNRISVQAGARIRPKVFPKTFLESNYEVNNVTATTNGSRFLIPKFETEIARSEFELAKSNAWPSLQIGPSYVREHLGDEKMDSLGIGLNITLPFYHQNQGEKAEASARIEQMRVLQGLKEQEASLDRERFIRIVEETRQTLSELRSKTNTNRIHDKIHRLLDRGVLSSQSVIESHRQLVDSLKAYNERELQGFDALWRVLALDGRLKTEKIQ